MGGVGHRWWDGTRWTGHVDSTPSRPAGLRPHLCPR
ncbi:DUF2510 domain-containing protein [Actinomadura rubrisoli]